MLATNIALLLGSGLLGGASGALLPTDLKVPQPGVCGLEKLFCYHTGVEAKNATRLEAAIDYACSQWHGHQFPKSEGEEGIAEYYSPRTDESTVSMVVRKTGRYNSLCGYRLLKDTCKYWLSKPSEQCPTQQGGNVTDLWCGLEWTIDPDDRELEKLGKGALQKMNCSTSTSESASSSEALDDKAAVRTTSGSSITFYAEFAIEKRENLPAPDSTSFSTSDFNEASCYNSGRTWSAEWLVKGADKFCSWAPSVEVAAGGYLNYTHHVCANGQDFRQWFAFENPDSKPYLLTYAACRIFTQPFIDDCNHADNDSPVKQGGWGVRSSSMNGYVVVDGDPDTHNPGKAEIPVENCNDRGWVKAIPNFYVSDRLSDAGMKFAAPPMT